MIYRYPYLYGLEDYNCQIPLDLLASARQYVVGKAEEYPSLQSRQHDPDLVSFTEIATRVFLQASSISLDNFTHVIRHCVGQYRRF